MDANKETVIIDGSQYHLVKAEKRKGMRNEVAILLNTDGTVKGKVCSKCGEPKLFADFHAHKDCLYGYDSACKVCRAAKQAEYDKAKKTKKNRAGRTFRCSGPGEPR